MLTQNQIPNLGMRFAENKSEEKYIKNKLF